MKKENIYVKSDSRNRITIPKEISNDNSHLYRIYKKNNTIILEPVQEISKDEQWLFDPKNKAIVTELKKALNEKADKTIDLNALLNSLDEI